jgi:lysophospholipase L1-like esterase
VTKPILVKIVYIGDSITYGQYLDPALHWTSIIKERLDKLYFNKPVLIYCLKKGVSGETTRMALERFPQDIQTQYPDIVTIQFGLNDCNCWLSDGGVPRVSPAAFKANLAEMIDRCRAFGVKEIILSNNHPTPKHEFLLNGDSYEEANERYSFITKTVAQEKKVTFSDIRQAFLSAENRIETYVLPYPDHLHLNESGNQVYANAIRPLIENAIERVIKSHGR